MHCLAEQTALAERPQKIKINIFLNYFFVLFGVLHQAVRAVSKKRPKSQTPNAGHPIYSFSLFQMMSELHCCSTFAKSH
jgi:hypothetical protein